MTIVQSEGNGYEFWHGSGRITVRNCNNIFRMTSVLVRNIQPDADVDKIIEAMGKKVTSAIKNGSDK
ncbi:hypothetical protein A3A67_01095 [Candidatus Peribacteria bacterium RIFCSPLOWO2_01_FULL_51_18]|nr:MAG: hypothetical protein A3C52_02880 [Candidatus Peribacteria bacterium RIFCSPHIGHO2_02_FULL_51_15]OGJ66300.1 MAG: hypothetical protein A3A67_01095 [Candidatus Peribacteria bacterium RIFCSPLOWO2_01_FULL_51_18]OGJ67863.1 MAG: hypothetical protein A3J34_03400 [Candidatus Peribacteria bacterium RIFCSPLOWO2_02_FULL_51_10]